MLGLVIVWGVLGFGLSVWAAFSFQTMCDKLDTGLGRIVQTAAEDTTGKPACATSGCESSFLYLCMTYAIAVVWSTVPYCVGLVWSVGIGIEPTTRAQSVTQKVTNIYPPPLYKYIFVMFSILSCSHVFYILF